MDWPALPSLTSLRAFAALAEGQSYTAAAAVLNVSHAAVSQQVKALEERLGVALVTRAGRGITLTPEGELLARDLDMGFAAIQRGVEALGGAGASRPVQISMSPAFAVEWLMPRIMEFQYQHPETTLMLNPTPEVVELKPGGIDMAIRYRGRDRVEPDATALLVSDMVVIGTPALIGTRASTDPVTLMDMPWLQELGTNEVAEWMARRGVRLDRPLIINHMPGNLIMEAVRRGDGITYTARAFFQQEIQSGQVVVLHSELAFGHYLIETAPGLLRPTVRTFLDWLKGKAERVTDAPGAAS
jgi:LysR family glycine cleavage system transcriptional activator